MRKVQFILLFSIYLCLCLACSRGPSDSDIEKAAVGKGDPLFQKISHLIEIKNFKVLNKYKSGNFWVAKIKYDLIFKEELDKVIDEITKMDKNNPFASMQAMLFKQIILSMCGEVKKNIPCSIEREVKLVKSDKGWIVPSQ